MKNHWLTVAKRELTVRVTEKTFWVTTLITLAVVLAGVMLPSVLADRESTYQVATVEPLAETIVATIDAESDNKWVSKPYADNAAAVAAVKDGEVDLAITKNDTGWKLTVPQFDNSSSSMTSRVQVAVTEVITADNAKKQGVDVTALNEGTKLTVGTTSEGSDREQLFAYLAGIIFAVLFFMSAMLFGTQIAASVIKEKESRVIEILTAAVPTRQLLTGKILGNSAVAFLQIALYLGTAIIGASFGAFGPMLPALAGGAAWFAAFFVTGFLALSCLWAAAGAMATKYEDINSTSMPLTMILMVGYIGAFAAPAAWQAPLSLVPVISSILMPMRLIGGTAVWWEAMIALALNLVFMVVGIVIGSALYRRGVLQTSSVLKWRDAFGKAA